MRAAGAAGNIGVFAASCLYPANRPTWIQFLSKGDIRMTNRLPVDPELVESAARLGNLSLPDGRKAELAPVMDGIFALLDVLDQGSLGETPPASAFDAGWEK